MKTHLSNYFSKAAEVASKIDQNKVEAIVNELVALRARGGRLFLLGVGGSAANCSHAVNDFRKLAGIEAYSPCDNVAELTARTNDEGWDTIFAAWLEVSNADENDVVFVMSVGGGNLEKNVSPNLVKALEYCKTKRVKILGIVGRDGGYTAKVGDVVVVVPTVDPNIITPLVESFHVVVWHGVVSHPSLMMRANKWEGMSVR
jgi:D-sedoheptulose 7-phosphate isomerase